MSFFKAPKVNFSELFDEESNINEYKWIFSKHYNWKYEKEWRVVVTQGNRLYPTPGEIKTVTFGLRMDKIKRKLVQHILRNEYDVQYFEMVRNKELLHIEAKRI